MVNFNLPTNQGNTQATLVTPSIDQGVVQQAQVSAGLTEQQLNAELGALDQANNQARRANLVAKEQKAQEDLGMADALIKMQNVSLNAINTIAQIDESRRRADEEKAAKAYSLNTTLQFQNDYFQFAREARANMSPDGAGYAESIHEFINSQLDNYVKGSPNEVAKLDVYERLSGFKIKAVSDAFDLEDKQRTSYRINQATNSVNYLTNQVSQDPASAPLLINNLAPIADTLRDNGVSESEVQDFLYAGKASIINAQVTGTLAGKNPHEAVTLLSSEATKSALPPQQYNRLVDETATLLDHYAKQQKVEAEKAMSVQAFAAGYLPKGAEGFDKAADAMAAQTLFSQIGDTSNIHSDQVPMVASALSGYFKEYNAGVGKDTKNIITNKILVSQNPYEVAAYAIGMDSLSKDPSGNKAAAFNDLDGEAKVLATRISNLASFGIDAKQAVELARNEIKFSKQPGSDQVLNTMIKDSDGVAGAIDAALDGWFTKVSDFEASQIKGDAEYVFRANLVKYKSVDLAKQETEKAIKNKYAHTEVDGETRIMEGAPELYYDGDLLNKFKTDLVVEKDKLAASLGIAKEDMYIQAISGRTTEQDRLDKKQYYVYNKKTGLPVQDDNYNFAVFTFSVDQTEYGAKLKEANAALAQKRADLNKAVTDNYAYLSKWKLSSKVDLTPFKK